MSKLLEKALKDAIKEKQCILGTKKVIGSSNSKLIVVSESTFRKHLQKIDENKKDTMVPIVHFNGSSVSLGKLCGLQFRVSTLSFTSITDANIKSILNENEGK